ncbi:MAG: hypothetical protein K0Q50_391 [Vampirovibrio sp.]|nr:hypothetical protein [Vampirovibrio sp.]
MNRLKKSIANPDSKIAFMPIKPVYAEKLINGEKHFEFRRRPISLNLTHIVVYASSPVQRILGIAKVNQVCIATPTETWLRTKEFAGIAEDAFAEYFSNSDIAYSIEIEPDETIKLDKQIHPREIDPEFQVPQSFRYVEENFLFQILAKGFYNKYKKSGYTLMNLIDSRLNDINTQMKNWANRSITFDFDSNGTNLYSILELAYSFAKRFVELSGSLQIMLEQENLVAAAIIARALYETVGMGCLYIDKITTQIEAKDLKLLNENFLQHYTGSCDGEIKPVRITKAIQHLELEELAYLDYLSQKISAMKSLLELMKEDGKDRPMKSNYAFLCELTHPNALGTHLIYGDPVLCEEHIASIKFKIYTSSTMAVAIGHHLLLALERTNMIPESYKQAFLE